MRPLYIWIRGGILVNTKPLGPFLGVNNRLPDFSLSVKDRGDYLRAADNVEITNSGSIVRRMAPVLLQAMSGAHSLCGNFFVRDSALYKATFSPYSEMLVKILTSNDTMSYAAINGDTYYSNGTDSGRISAAGVVYPWALPTPVAPSVAPSVGSLFKGTYQVAVSYTNNITAEEGGVSASTNHELAADGGLTVTLPAATVGATHINVYVSTVNGSIPMLQTTVATGMVSVTIQSLVSGRESIQRYDEPLPAGTRLFEFNGRLCSIKGSALYYGLPYRHGYYLPADGYIPFAESISVAVPNQGGLYVAADKTYFLAGQDLGAVEAVRDVLPYGAVPGTEFSVPNRPIVGWFGEKGIVLADAQGAVEAVMADSIDLTPPASGFSAVLETRGYRRVVSCGWCLNLENMAATTYSGWGIESASGEYCTKADGIYLLEGDGDVDAYIGLGKQNFGVENLKALPAVYVGAASEYPLVLVVTLPNGTEYEYPARSCSDTVEIHRIDPGKGLKENWYGLAIKNERGSFVTLASASFAPVASGRKI